MKVQCILPWKKLSEQRCEIGERVCQLKEGHGKGGEERQKTVDEEEYDKMRWDLASLKYHAGSLNYSAMIHARVERRALIQEIL